MTQPKDVSDLLEELKNNEKLIGLLTISLIEGIQYPVTAVKGEAMKVSVCVGMVGDFLCHLAGVLAQMEAKNAPPGPQ